MFLLYVTSKEVIKIYLLFKKHDLTYTSFMVIMAIENEEKINIKSLGRRVFLDSGTLTYLLKKLEKKATYNVCVKKKMKEIFKLH